MTPDASASAFASAAAPPRVVLTRFSSIGDVILTTPLVRAIRRRHPDAHLAFVTKTAMAPLLRDNPHLDELITLAPEDSLWDLGRRVRAGRFTHRLDLHGKLRSYALRVLAPGHWHGYHVERAARARLIRTKEDRYPAHTHVVERYFEAAEGLDVRPDGQPPEFFLNPAEVEKARAWLATRGIQPGSGYVVLAPGAAHFTKRWPVEHWTRLARQLEATGRTVVIVGGPDEKEAAAAIASSGTAHDAAGRFGLQGTGALVADAAVLISGDTGVMHLATGLDTPVIALFGPTVRAFGFTPYTSNAIILERDLPCRPCSKHGGPTCPLGHHRCLRKITAEEVLAAVERSAA